MIKPLIAIVGRPNVGKSTFFNKVAGKRISIVENKPGVTRDRIYADGDWNGVYFTMIDTGGIELKSTDEMWMHIRKQAEIAVDTCDLIIFMIDGRAGLTPDDYEVAEFLRRSGKPVVLAVNKIDNKPTDDIYEYYALGLGEPIPVSAEQSKGLGDLLDEAVKPFTRQTEEREQADGITVAVAGKPNAGKSSLVNRILGFDRVIVSDIAGTTRDAVDTPFTYEGQKYIIVDTAGIRRKRSVDEDVEYYSVVRAFAAVRRADVAVIVFDSSEEISEQDVRIAGYAHEEGKPVVIVMNKWDKIEKETNTMKEYTDMLKEKLSFMDYFEPVYLSALTGKRAERVMQAVVKVYNNTHKKITTGALNDVIHESIAVNQPPTKNGQRLKIKYVSQVGTAPPVFAIFVNDKTLMHFSYERYLENEIRKAFDFSGTPIKIVIRDKETDN